MSGEAARSPLESLADSTLAELKRYPPFDEMDADALHYLVGRLCLGYYPRGASILSPQQGEPSTFFIVQRGFVRVDAPDIYDAGGGSSLTLGPGECFSVGALLEGRAVSAPYVAVADTFCYELPADGFRELLHRSPRFQDFTTRYLTSLLQDSRRLLKLHFSRTVTEQQAMNRPLRTLIGRPPVSCTPDTPVGAALQSMRQENIGSIIVATPTGEPVGILTRHDVLDRVALARLDLAAPISWIMTPQPFTLPAEASTYEAALEMARRGWRHLPVVDEGRLVGVVTERDLFALQWVSLRQINRTISHAAGLEDLQQGARDIRRLAHSLMGQGVAAEQLTSIISALNDTLTQRVIELEMAGHDLSGFEWCWLAFGSEGRYEQTISTDQDNGLIFSTAREEDEATARGRLLPFAEAVNRTLDACGFPLCKGGIMAGNPRWCLSRAEWQHQFAGWIADTDPEALLKAMIFFDFRPVYGCAELVSTLRDWLLGVAAANTRFLRQLAEQALTTAPPLGMLRDFVVDSDGRHPGTLDLKASGARLFVDAGRIIGLATGIQHTGTAQRLRYGGARLNMGEMEIASAVEAFFFIQMLRLRNQFGAGDDRSGHNRIDPHALNEVDRRILKECFRQARKLQTRLKLDYQL